MALRASGWRPTLERAAPSLAARLGPVDAVVSMCWATVDLDRALGGVDGPRSAGHRDDILGATVTRLTIDGYTLLVGEPATEGRLAAYLARFGEGVAAAYLEGAPTSPGGRRGRTGLGRIGVLQGTAPRWGPFMIGLLPATPG